MNPRRLHNETILSINSADLGSAIRSDSVCDARNDVKVPGLVVVAQASRLCVSIPLLPGALPSTLDCCEILSRLVKYLLEPNTNCVSVQPEVLNCSEAGSDNGLPNAFLGCPCEKYSRAHIPLKCINPKSIPPKQ